MIFLYTKIVLMEMIVHFPPTLFYFARLYAYRLLRIPH